MKQYGVKQINLRNIRDIKKIVKGLRKKELTPLYWELLNWNFLKERDDTNVKTWKYYNGDNQINNAYKNSGFKIY